MPKRARTVALLSAMGCVLLVAVFALNYREDLGAWLRGYRVIWLPEGVTPRSIGKRFGRNDYIAVNVADKDGKSRAGRWSIRSGSWSPLPSVSELPSRTSVVNDHGTIVGTFDTGRNELFRPYLWTETEGMRKLPTLGGRQTAPADMNERNQVVGSTLTSTGRRAVLWTQKDGIRDLGGLVKGGRSVAQAINTRGWIVGQGRAADGLYHPFLWKPGSGMMDLGLPTGFIAGFVVDINDRGEILASFSRKGPTVGNSTYYLATPFLWIEGKGSTEVPSPPGDSTVRAVAINNAGSVLLEAGNPPDHATTGFLVIDGSPRQLPDPGETGLTRWSDLSDTGWLIGTTGMSAVEVDGRWRGVLLKLLR